MNPGFPQFGERHHWRAEFLGARGSGQVTRRCRRARGQDALSDRLGDDCLFQKNAQDKANKACGFVKQYLFRLWKARDGDRAQLLEFLWEFETYTNRPNPCSLFSIYDSIDPWSRRERWAGPT
jgi:hypothetical protein